MGLDMYLTGRRFIGEYLDKELSDKLNEATKDITKGRVCNEIIIEAMYWRKANAIHQWFVKNVQEGIDDCLEHKVSITDLKRLLETVTEVLDKKVAPADALPSQTGFFFGSSEYNEWYFEDLKYTKESLTKLLEELCEETDQFDIISDWHFSYRSSW